jgi:dTDP-glucose 4,6-dehydratase
VIVLDKLTYAGNLGNLAGSSADPRYRFVKGDIADVDLVTQVLDDHQPDAIVNFAAETHVDRSIDDPEAFVRTNVVGTYVLLQAARIMLKRLERNRRKSWRFLQISTDEIYGSLGESGRFSEDTPVAPNSPYSASKAGADHLVRAYNRTYGLPAIITNCSNNYGPYQFPEKLIPLMILNALEGKDLPIYGDGGNVRDWLYVEDHCRGILEVLNRGEMGEVYNLGGECEQTNLELVDLLCAVLEEQRPAAENPSLQARGINEYGKLKAFVEDRPGHDRRYAMDVSKIKEKLGWEPRHTLEQGLRKTVRWYLENLRWCEAVQAKGYRRERLGLSS